MFRKYAAVIGGLVVVALVANASLEAVFSYQEHQTALMTIQREKTRFAAISIEHFVLDVERLLGSTNPIDRIAAERTTEERQAILFQLLRQAPALMEAAYLDQEGQEQVRVSRLTSNVLGSQADLSHTDSFVVAREGRTYFGPVYFRNGSEPFMTVAAREVGMGGGIVVAEVNLKFIWDVVSGIDVGGSGYAYVVDGRGHLIAHPDIALVLRQTDLSSLPQIRAALDSRSPGQSGRPTAMIGSDTRGSSMLTATQVIVPPGWVVVVEQPTQDAYAPAYSSLARAGLLLVFALALSVAIALLLARRMVRPIYALQTGAAQIGAGALNQRIAVRTGDELESLAEEFNRMASRLRESYADLEKKVDTRTHALAEAMAELERRGRELEITSQHKSEFLANMSHELRTPLNAIIGFSEVLLERLVGQLNEKQEEYLHDILESGHHLLSLINEILDLSKVEAGRMNLDLSHFWLPETITDCLTMVRPDANRHTIELNLLADPGVGLIEADERKVKQVLFNLLSNAVKFTADGGEVEVSAAVADDEIVISVRDNGIGIALDEQERVFDEFYQSSATADGRVAGTGLGLPLARRFVELHSGRLWLESAPGEGSCFSFTLPLGVRNQPTELAPTGAVTAPAPAGRRRGTVLVVEDDPHAIDLLTVQLDDAGYEVAVAGTVEQGLGLARMLQPQAITLDIKLPGTDGWEFLVAAKADPTTARIPIIIVSMVDERARGLALGAFDYLVKPVGRDSLLAALRALPAA